MSGLYGRLSITLFRANAGLYWLGRHHFYDNDFVSLVGTFVVLCACIIIII